MAQTLARRLVNNTPLKLFSLLLGYLMWHILSSHQTITKAITIPVCFYNTTQERTIKAPETLQITLRGKRSSFNDAYMKDLALHIDAAALTKQTTIVPVSSSQLFLPESIALVNYVPSPLIIQKNIQQLTTEIAKEPVK